MLRKKQLLLTELAWFSQYILVFWPAHSTLLNSQDEWTGEHMSINKLKRLFLFLDIYDQKARDGRHLCIWKGREDNLNALNTHPIFTLSEYYTFNDFQDDREFSLNIKEWQVSTKIEQRNQ